MHSLKSNAPDLTSVRLRIIDDEQLKRFCRAVADNDHLQSLSVFGGIKDSSHLGDMLRRNHSLRALCVLCPRVCSCVCSCVRLCVRLCVRALAELTRRIAQIRGRLLHWEQRTRPHCER